MKNWKSEFQINYHVNFLMEDATMITKYEGVVIEAENEKQVQDFQIRNQKTLLELDKIIAGVRAKILDEVKPILEEISKERGITVIMEKSSVILNADNMDITELVIKKLNKSFPKIKVELE